jgi:hypothetical protein
MQMKRRPAGSLLRGVFMPGNCGQTAQNLTAISAAAMAVSMAVIVMRIAVAIPMFTVVLLFTVVVAVVVPAFFAHLASVPVMFPAAMPSPVCALTAARQRPTIAKPRIETTVKVSMKSNRPVEPRSCAHKSAAYKPLRAIVTKRRTMIRRVIEVSIGTHRLWSYIDLNVYLCLCRLRCRCGAQNNREESHCYCLHCLLTLPLGPLVSASSELLDGALHTYVQFPCHFLLLAASCCCFHDRSLLQALDSLVSRRAPIPGCAVISSPESIHKPSFSCA